MDKDQVLELANQQMCELDMKLKQSNKKLNEKGHEDNKLLKDINRISAELKKWQENYSCLETQNTRLNVRIG